MDPSQLLDSQYSVNETPSQPSNITDKVPLRAPKDRLDKIISRHSEREKLLVDIKQLIGDVVDWTTFVKKLESWAKMAPIFSIIWTWLIDKASAKRDACQEEADQKGKQANKLRAIQEKELKELNPKKTVSPSGEVQCVLDGDQLEKNSELFHIVFGFKDIKGHGIYLRQQRQQELKELRDHLDEGGLVD